jgi:signal transduction histidine kinase
MASSGAWNACAQPSFTAGNLPVTNLLQLAQLVTANERLMRDIQLEATVCAASEPAAGVVILQDDTNTELFEFTGGTPQLSAGDRVRISRKNCLLRRREMGVELSIRPVVDNDGLHGKSTTAGGIGLKAGRHPMEIDWFNRADSPILEVRWIIPGLPPADFPVTNLFTSNSPADSKNPGDHPGLVAECFEGNWDRVPNFNLLTPAKICIATNFDLGFLTRDDMVGVRFRGFFDAPVDGVYGFRTRSANGSLLFIDDFPVSVSKIGTDVVLQPSVMTIGQPLPTPNSQPWVTVEGRVGSVSNVGRGVDLELLSGHNSLVGRIADAQGLNTSNLLNSKIRLTGVGFGLLNFNGEAMLGQVVMANGRGVEIISPSTAGSSDTNALTKAQQVQSLTLEDARQHRAVHLSGVVTSKGKNVDAWLSIQDDTRGVFVSTHSISNYLSTCGDFDEIIGHSDVGDFAPVVVADRLVRLGMSELPRPLRPTWDELNNGSMDVQWVEFNGLVTTVRSNVLSVLLPAGQIEVQVEGPSFSGMKHLEKAVVRIRGVLFAVWNAAREVRAGSIIMRNASLFVDTPASNDPFDAVLKTPRELLLFDAQASAFRPVKIRGQIVYADPTQAFLQDGGQGLRLLPAGKTTLKPGELVEAVGYPDISGQGLLLRAAVTRKTGEAHLPPPPELSELQSGSEGLDSTRVQLTGRLLGWHLEQDNMVLELQSKAHLFLARLARSSEIPLRVGSLLALQGVYVNKTAGKESAAADAFELLLNSTDDIQVRSQPSWWTLERLLILIGVLATILVFSAVWIRQLRRLVEQRTVQLQKEIHERELAEKHRAVEVERARIARDLHDDLGASLTEIAVLAGKGQRSISQAPAAQPILATITSKARELVAALDIIVWAVDPKDNTLQSVADYLCDFTEEFLSSSGISCRFDVPVSLPVIVLEGRVRHDLFLAVKETLNNIVRHSGATEVEFRLALADDLLEIFIVDNGKGFDPEVGQSGKGQKSLPLRLSQIGGRYEIRSTAGKGTLAKIELRLPGRIASR